MEKDDCSVAVEDSGRRAVHTREEDDDISMVEAKALFRASLPDAVQHLHQQVGVHLGQDQPMMEIVCYFSFVRRLYDMNGNVFCIFSCSLNDGWLLLRNIELICVPHRYILQ
uniref:Uncharacterized protein n=1 Tax=Oryza punctata TaxID=4537 RepID=A0A0E0MM77_ORYPU